MRHRTGPSSTPTDKSVSTPNNGKDSSSYSSSSASTGTPSSSSSSSSSSGTASPSAQFLYNYLKRDTYCRSIQRERKSTTGPTNVSLPFLSVLVYSSSYVRGILRPYTILPSSVIPIVHYALSWEDPFTSFTFIAYGFAIYLAYSILDYPLLSVIVWLSLLGCIVSGIIHIIRIYQFENKLPSSLNFLKDKPRIAINSDYIRTIGSNVSEYIITGLLTLNSYLEWSRPYESIKLICTLWLISRYIFLFSPGYLLTFYLLSFGILPLYRRLQNEIDKGLVTIIFPHVKTIVRIQKVTENLLLKYYKLYPLIVPIMCAMGIGTILWIFWDFWTIISLCTTVSFLILGFDSWNKNFTNDSVSLIHDGNVRNNGNSNRNGSGGTKVD